MKRNIPNQKKTIKALDARVETSAIRKKVDLTMSALASNKQTVDFVSEDFNYLSKNENGRFAFNSRKVAHALIISDVEGNKSALQYPLPTPSEIDTPDVRPIQQVEEIERLGSIRYKAKGLDGKTWYSNRSLHVEMTGDDGATLSGDLAYFSEEEGPHKEPAWDNQKKLPRFHSDVTDASLPTHKLIKGGHELEVDPVSVIERDTIRTRGVSQNQLMKQSARDAYEHFFSQMETKLSDELITILRRAFTANINATPENQYRPEWLHAYGFSLTPKTHNPQQVSNLGAAGKWINTEMMILERIAKWFALNQEMGTRITIKTLFEMLGKSELIDMIYFDVSIEFRDRFIRLRQELDAFKEAPVFRKASDLAQTTGISQHVLYARPPLTKEKVIKLRARDAISGSSASDSPWRLVPECITPRTSEDPRQYIATIIDVETTGLDTTSDQIIEIGMISFSFTKNEGITAFINSYGAFNDPGIEVSPEVLALTTITKEQLQGSSIDWDAVFQQIEKSDYIICHNSEFDRKFLERATPLFIQNKFKSMKFGCTLRDINWQAKGFPIHTLSYLNSQLGFYYHGHRAVNDCWATLNLLNELPGAMNELMAHVNHESTLLCAVDAPYAAKDALKSKGFRWSSGDHGSIPKCWFIQAHEDELYEIKQWLDDEIYGVQGRSNNIPQCRHITATDRYSIRAERLSTELKNDPRWFASKRKLVDTKDDTPSVKLDTKKVSLTSKADVSENHSSASSSMSGKLN
jgi:DNA polymerase-3 subunit epsilon